MYSLIIEKRVRRTLKKLPRFIRLRINNSIINLQNNPRQFGYKKLKNMITIGLGLVIIELFIL